MSKLYACIISEAGKAELTAVAREFSYGIEMLDDGVLFDVTGLEKLIGKPPEIARKILDALKKQNIPGNIAVAETVNTALLLARQKKGLEHSVAVPDEFQQLPLADLGIENDAIGIFKDLGIYNVEQLRQIPVDDLVNRYGQQFRNVIDVIEQKGTSFLTPNIKDGNARWNFDLDFPVDDFEQLIFIINHGLDNLLGQIERSGLSTEQIDISLRLNNKTERRYEIKTSFPTLERTFWLKLINLRISLDPPEAAIVSVTVVSHFTKPRPSQHGLYAVNRPEPESLLLTVGKLKKLVGQENVGMPVLVNQRLAEPFILDAEKMPDLSNSDRRPDRGITSKEVLSTSPARRASPHSEAAEPQDESIIAFVWYRPPLRAEVLVRDGRLIFLKTRQFSGHVTEYSGVWKANSKWWDKSWKTQEWDVEVENNGVYRLCKLDKEWFLAGEYD